MQSRFKIGIERGALPWRATNLLPRGVTVACRVLTPTVLVQIRARQPNHTLGGEIASRLAYTQKSRGQNLPERPRSIAPLHNRSAPVSETGMMTVRKHFPMRQPIPAIQ